MKQIPVSRWGSKAVIIIVCWILLGIFEFAKFLNIKNETVDYITWWIARDQLKALDIVNCKSGPEATLDVPTFVDRNLIRGNINNRAVNTHPYLMVILT